MHTSQSAQNAANAAHTVRELPFAAPALCAREFMRQNHMPFTAPEAALLEERWAIWLRGVHSRLLVVDGAQYALIYLDADVACEVDAAWAASPSRGFLLASLANTLCAACVAAAVPGVAAHGCAAVPFLHEGLRRMLNSLNIPIQAAGPIHETAGKEPGRAAGKADKSTVEQSGDAAAQNTAPGTGSNSVPGTAGGHIIRRYTVLTQYPGTTGCAACSLERACPKRKKTLHTP